MAKNSYLVIKRFKKSVDDKIKTPRKWRRELGREGSKHLCNITLMRS